MKKENGDRKLIGAFPIVLEKAVMQYATNTLNPAVNSGSRLFGLSVPQNSPSAPKNSVIKEKEIANRRNSANGNPDLNKASVKNEASK